MASYEAWRAQEGRFWSGLMLMRLQLSGSCIKI